MQLFVPAKRDDHAHPNDEITENKHGKLNQSPEAVDR